MMRARTYRIRKLSINCTVFYRKTRLIIGKAKIKHQPNQKTDGEKDMRAAAATIMEVGQDWEKESIPGIMKAAGLM